MNLSQHGKICCAMLPKLVNITVTENLHKYAASTKEHTQVSPIWPLKYLGSLRGPLRYVYAYNFDRCQLGIGAVELYQQL